MKLGTRLLGSIALASLTFALAHCSGSDGSDLMNGGAGGSSGAGGGDSKDGGATTSSSTSTAGGNGGAGTTGGGTSGNAGTATSGTAGSGTAGSSGAGGGSGGAGGSTSDASTEMDGAVQCMGTHPLVDGGARFCAVDACYCGNRDACFPVATATACCPSQPVCASDAGPQCQGTHPLLDGGARFCAPGHCRCVNTDACFPMSDIDRCCQGTRTCF
jgi:hypothetical protein